MYKMCAPHGITIIQEEKVRDVTLSPFVQDPPGIKHIIHDKKHFSIYIYIYNSVNC